MLAVNVLRTDGEFCHQGRAGHRNCPEKLRLSERTDMTIRWKALEEHFPMIPFVLIQLYFFWGKMHFLNFSKKPRSLACFS
jgi:hypothetical protein